MNAGMLLGLIALVGMLGSLAIEPTRVLVAAWYRNSRTADVVDVIGHELNALALQLLDRAAAARARRRARRFARRRPGGRAVRRWRARDVAAYRRWLIACGLVGAPGPDPAEVPVTEPSRVVVPDPVPPPLPDPEPWPDPDRFEVEHIPPHPELRIAVDRALVVTAEHSIYLGAAA